MSKPAFNDQPGHAVPLADLLKKDKCTNDRVHVGGYFVFARLKVCYQVRYDPLLNTLVYATVTQGNLGPLFETLSRILDGLPCEIGNWKECPEYRFHFMVSVLKCPTLRERLFPGTPLAPFWTNETLEVFLNILTGNNLRDMLLWVEDTRQESVLIAKIAFQKAQEERKKETEAIK